MIELQFKVVFKGIKHMKVNKCELKVHPGAEGEANIVVEYYFH